MIILEKLKLVIFTPPKCGTTTLHAALRNRPDFNHVIGPQFDGIIEKHTVCLPWHVRESGKYKLVCQCRNPFTRALSLYGHKERYWSGKDMDFSRFVREILVAPRYAFYNSTISSMLERPFLGDGKPLHIDSFLHLEYLNTDLASVGINLGAPLPIINPSYHPGLEEYNEETEFLVRIWGHHDFALGNYSKELPCGEDRSS